MNSSPYFARSAFVARTVSFAPKVLVALLGVVLAGAPLSVVLAQDSGTQTTAKKSPESPQANADDTSKQKAPKTTAKQTKDAAKKKAATTPVTSKDTATNTTKPQRAYRSADPMALPADLPSSGLGKPLPVPSPAEDARAMVEHLEDLGQLVGKHAKSCDEMALALELFAAEHATDMQSITARLDALDPEQTVELAKHHRGRLEAVMTTMHEGVAACSGDVRVSALLMSLSTVESDEAKEPPAPTTLEAPSPLKNH